MPPTLQQSSVKNGSHGARVSTFSENTTRDLSIDEIINHPDLEKRISQQTKITCEEVVEEFFVKARKLVYPLVGIIGFLLSFIFHQSNESLKNLNDSVVELNATMRVYQGNIDAMQRDIDHNRENIDKLGDRLYKK